MDKSILTQSAAAAFRDCRKRAELRYERGLVPQDDADALRFGHLWAGAQEQRAHLFKAGTHTPDAVVAWIEQNAVSLADAVLGVAMYRGYCARWDLADELWEMVAIEQEFRTPILNPETGAPSRSFDAGGKMDRVVRRTGLPVGNGLWLKEDKTTSRLDDSYLERLWLDFQITYYAAQFPAIFGEPCRGVIYDISVKPPKSDAAQDLPETDAEWEARLAAAKAPGRCKRRMGETEAEWRERLLAKCANPNAFHREEILLSQEDIDQVAAETWDITQAWLDARRNHRWYRNTSQCFGHYGRACDFLQVCKSRENPVVIENHYRVERLHRELSAETAGAPTTAF